MAKMSPKNIDKVFQKGSEQYDFEYNEEAWAHMEGLLEKDDRRRFIWWWFAGAVALALFGLMYFVFSSKNVDQTNNLKIEKIDTDKSESELANNTKGLNRETNLELDKTNTEKEETTTISQNDNLNNSKINIKKLDGDFENANSNNNSITNVNSEYLQSTSRKSNPKSQLENDRIKQHPNLFEIKDAQIGSAISSTNSSLPLSNTPIDTLNSIRKDSKIDVASLTLLKISKIEYALLELPNLTELGLGEELAIEFDTINLEKNLGLEEDQESKNEFVIGGIIGTEISAIGSKISEQELKFGGQIEYRFGRKFSTSIGVTYIKKDYGAKGEDYSVRPGYWEDGIAPQDVIAHCDMLEIPVKVSYFFKDFSKNGFYSSLGLTSYLMRNERYYYKYEITNATQRKYWMGSNENNHWFGLGHVAFGYQYHIGNKFSVQIEPYAELPITRVGHGNVRLWSFGVSGKFNFHIK